MNPATRKSLSVGEVRSWLPRTLACGLLVVLLAGWTTDDRTLPDLTVHEWGTFTAIAGKDGRAAGGPSFAFLAKGGHSLLTVSRGIFSAGIGDNEKKIWSGREDLDLRPLVPNSVESTANSLRRSCRDTPNSDRCNCR